MPAPPAAVPPPPLVQRAMVGGIVALIVARVEDGKGESLAELRPELVELFLGPFVGTRTAAAAARVDA